MSGQTPLPPSRKPLRLQDHDYSQFGPYFVTICTHNKRCNLGSVAKGRVILSATGDIAREAWHDLPNRFPNLILDALAIMPNHVHGILALVGAGLAPPDIRANTNSSPSPVKKVFLSDVICAFKSITTTKVNRLFHAKGQLLWQRGYYEHIIRGGDDMKNVQRYVLENPMKWERDPENTNPIPLHGFQPNAKGGRSKPPPLQDRARLVEAHADDV